MLLVRCPWCGPRDEIEFRYGGQAGLTYPEDPEALSDEEWADYLFMRDNPKGTVPGTLVPHRGMPALVQRRAGHGDPPVRRDVPARRGAAGVTGRRLPDGGTWIDRSRPISVHVRRS